MKRTEEDQKLSRLLQHSSFQETENEWFTPRVLHRLPEKPPHGYRWLPVMLYVLAMLVIAACWYGLLWKSDLEVITVRDIVYFVVLIVVTILLLWQAIHDFVGEM